MGRGLLILIVGMRAWGIGWSVQLFLCAPVGPFGGVVRMSRAVVAGVGLCGTTVEAMVGARASEWAGAGPGGVVAGPVGRER